MPLIDKETAVNTLRQVANLDLHLRLNGQRLQADDAYEYLHNGTQLDPPVLPRHSSMKKVLKFTKACNRLLLLMEAYDAMYRIDT